jgi:hypothetical protein
MEPINFNTQSKVTKTRLCLGIIKGEGKIIEQVNTKNNVVDLKYVPKVMLDKTLMDEIVLKYKTFKDKYKIPPTTLYAGYDEYRQIVVMLDAVNIDFRHFKLSGMDVIEVKQPCYLKVALN